MLHIHATLGSEPPWKFPFVHLIRINDVHDLIFEVFVENINRGLARFLDQV